LVRVLCASFGIGILLTGIAGPSAAAVDAAAISQSDAGQGAGLAHPTGVPSDAELIALLRATLEKVDYGNKTGDYHSLHAELTPQVQKVVDVTRLASALEGFRKLHVDMSAVDHTAPLYERAPEVTPNGLLSLRGAFPTSPREIRFDFGFVRTDGQWRIQALNLDTPGTATPNTTPTAPQTAAPQIAAAPPGRPRVIRKAVDSPFLDTSTDPPTATKW
jgi:hypothetical protein